MKTIKLYVFLVISILSIAGVTAQTVEEIVKKHTDAVGGKTLIDQIKSLYYETTIEMMGNESPSNVSILDGKAIKVISEFNGSQMISCYTDSFGWTVNPMAGQNEPTPMPADMYKMGKEQIYIGGPLVDFEKKGNKIELMGQEMIGAVNAYKLKLTTALNAEMFLYIDPSTYYAIQTEMKIQMMGQDMNIIVTNSDFRKTDLGFVMPFKSENNFGDQFYMTTKITKVELNKAIDPSIFKMNK
jgi:outer membrane lipoprotein-sorting protein